MTITLLFEDKLRWWRVETARKHNVPVYVIFHDATMREITKAKLGSLDDLRQVSGVREENSKPTDMKSLP